MKYLIRVDHDHLEGRPRVTVDLQEAADLKPANYEAERALHEQMQAVG
jgi:hypothetical protein